MTLSKKAGAASGEMNDYDKSVVPAALMGIVALLVKDNKHNKP